MSRLIDFAGNDYLGLAHHPVVLAAMQDAAARYGISAAGSRFSIGWTDLHERLERELAAFVQAEDACLLAAAYLGGAAYFGQMAALGHRVVFCDKRAHASQYMGMRAAGLEIRPWLHLDFDDLERQIAAYAGPPPIVATDGVYGMTGEVAPLAELARIAERFGAELFVDDAHGFGVLGAEGRGTLEHCGLRPGRITMLGSLSKAAGASGGFLAGRRDLVERFRRSPESVGSTALPTPLAAAALAALEIIRTQPALRTAAKRNADRMREVLRVGGIAVATDHHPIVAMLLADEPEAAGLSRHFATSGLRIPHFAYPSDPQPNLLRAIGRGVHAEADLAQFATAVRTWTGRAAGGP